MVDFAVYALMFVGWVVLGLITLLAVVTVIWAIGTFVLSPYLDWLNDWHTNRLIKKRRD